MDLAKARKKAEALKKKQREEAPRAPTPDEASSAPLNADPTEPTQGGRSRPDPSSRKEAVESPPVADIRRDARDDPFFRDVLSATPREDEVLGLLTRADENPEYPKMDAPPNARLLPRAEPLATLMEEAALEQQTQPATGPAPVGGGAYDAIWDDGQGRLLGLVEEELFRRAFGDKRLKEAVGEKFIGFKLAGEHYALSVLEIGEILKLKPLTSVPRVAGHILGVLSLRGTIIPIIDLRRRFGLPANRMDRQARILVLRESEGRVGLVVEQVEGVVKIPDSRIEPPPPAMDRTAAPFVRGVGRVEGRFYLLLDAPRLADMSDIQAGREARA